VKERIIFYPEMVAFGGAERIVLALSRHLHQGSVPHQLTLYYLSVDLQSHAHWPVPVRELRPLRSPWRKVRALRDYLRAMQGAESGNALLVGIQAAVHAGCLGASDYTLMILDTPSLLSETTPRRGLGPRLRRAMRISLSKQFLRRGLRRARKVITTSRYMAEEIGQLSGCQAVIARQGGVSPTKSSAATAKSGSIEIRILSVSRLEANKRIDWILRALCSPDLRSWLEENDPSWQLEIVGEGSECQALRALAAALGLEKRVRFAGHLSDTQLEQAYANATLFVMPAFQGYGLPALEALARRVPVVMHRQSGVSEILNGTPWVELIDGTTSSLASGMLEILCRIRLGSIAHHPLPRFPSESDWADEICGICGWR
jgi:glycosyltransferase involved in cell wall biosynthesis